MNLRKNANRLEILEAGEWKTLREFALPITDFKVIPDRGILVQTAMKRHIEPRNLFLIGFDGEPRWQIPPTYSTGTDPQTSTDSPPDCYGGFWIEGGKLIAFASFGHEYEVDWDTGELTYLRWTK